MDPDAVDRLCSSGLSEDTDSDGSGRECGVNAGRVPHGGTDDPLVLDFSSTHNTQTPPGIARIYEAALSAARSYPSDNYYEFRAAAAEYVGTDATQVIPTPGGLAALRLVVATMVTADDDVLVPAPAFGEFAREVRLQGANPEFVPHADLLSTDPAEYALVVTCSPNNPTGEAHDVDALWAYADRCRSAGTPLLVDEAFADFTRDATLAGHDGAIVVRAMSQFFGLPGMRAGYAVASGQYRDRLDTARPAWGLGSPAAAVGAHCLRQTEFVAETRERIGTERERMVDRLRTRFDVPDSKAPFLLLDAGSSDAVDEVLETVREHDIAVRDARSFRGLDQHVRVAVRMPYENDLLLDALGV